MYQLGCEKVSLEFSTKQVFSDLSLGVDEGARIGIVGRNGDGKSTLLRLLAGEVEPDEGRVVKTRGVRVGLLGQRDHLDDEMTVRQAVVGEVEQYVWAGNARTREIISGLLFDIPWESCVKTLSGGQRRRVDLARLLIGDWDVLALDEPTNHLDMRTISWLAHHLKTRWKPDDGVLLVVTHDRWFLDEVCLDMWEVHDCVVEPFEGGYSAYIMQRVERERLAALAEQKRQNLLRRELAWLSRGARARATKPKFHVAAAQELIADVPPLRNEIELKRMAMARLGKQVVELHEATVTFGPHCVLDRIEWMIGPGDRYGLVGANGAGKTTMLRLLQGLIEPSRGSVKIGKTVRFAFLSQTLDNLAEVENDRVRQVVSRYTRRTMLDGKEQTPAQLLESLGFTNADLNEPIKDLSGGQRRRLSLMMILMDEPNVLILDEPGNDLDTDMLSAMESLLDGWPGTLILVTHDRYLMERVTDDQFALIDGRLVHLPGGVDEYFRLMANVRVNVPAFAAITAAGAENPTSRDAAAGAASDEHTPRLSGGEIRTLRKAADQAERKMATTQGKIEAAQERMALTDPSDYLELGKIQAEIDDLRTTLDDLENQWLEAIEQLEG